MTYRSDEWTTATGELSDRLAHVRQNVSLVDADRQAHPWVLLLTLIFTDLDEDGMPTQDAEREAADVAEEALADRFEQEYHALFGLAITSEGARELFLFLRDELPEPELERTIDDLGLALDYDFFLERDPRWQAYTFIRDVTGE